MSLYFLFCSISGSICHTKFSTQRMMQNTRQIRQSLSFRHWQNQESCQPQLCHRPPRWSWCLEHLLQWIHRSRLINGHKNHNLGIFGFTVPTACFATSVFFNLHITYSDIAYGLAFASRYICRLAWATHPRSVTLELPQVLQMRGGQPVCSLLQAQARGRFPMRTRERGVQVSHYP